MHTGKPERASGDVVRAGFRIGEHLQLDRAGAAVECVACGHRLCAAGERWKDHAASRRSAPAAAGPLRVADGRCSMLEFFCPGCGTVLDVDAAYADDGPLPDTIHSWAQHESVG